MLNATHATQTPNPGRAAARATPVMGGEAWIVPFEPGGPVWITASAPAIRMIDNRRPAAPAARG